jgi:dolichol-phosphate mannosyltransferase
MIEAEADFLMNWVGRGQVGMLSVVIPAHNECGNIKPTVLALVDVLTAAAIDHEILIVNDHSTDETEQECRDLERDFPTVRCLNNRLPNGFGLAVRSGLSAIRGEAVAVVMADGSDAPDDLVRYWRKLQEGYDCVFGSRFIKGGSIIDYPIHKFILNRIANAILNGIFLHGFNDTTNAFKCYRREVIAGVQPLLSNHFNLTIEIPLKAIIRGFSFAVIPISWRNRKTGISKLKIREMGSRYIFIMLYCILEKSLSRGDYRRQPGLPKSTMAAIPGRAARSSPTSREE